MKKKKKKKEERRRGLFAVAANGFHKKTGKHLTLM